MAKESRYLSDEELKTFRTQPCVHKALRRECPNGEDCLHSHCLSWCRRNPSEVPYRPGLCSFVVFQKDQNQTRVKNFCNRGRFCPHAHTKEEQMYHPMVYKTKPCRAYPACFRTYCPFAHGPRELRRPDYYRPQDALYEQSQHLGGLTEYHPYGYASPMLSPLWGAGAHGVDEPLSQPSYPSSSSQSAASQRRGRQLHDLFDYVQSPRSSSQCMEPLGNLVLGSDGHLYLRVIPTR